MATMTVELPDPLRSWVEEKAAADGFATAADYLRDLVRRDRETAEGTLSLDELRGMMADARASGVSGRSLDDIFLEAVGRSGSEPDR